jgi:hypothetical protein
VPVKPTPKALLCLWRAENPVTFLASVYQFLMRRKYSSNDRFSKCVKPWAEGFVDRLIVQTCITLHDATSMTRGATREVSASIGGLFDLILKRGEFASVMAKDVSC